MVFSFQKLDILSPKITLFFKGKVHHSSSLSMFLSLLSILITICFSIIFLQDLKRKNPSAFFYNRFLDEVNPIPYNSSGLFHLLNLTDDKFPYEPNKLFTIVGVDNYMYLFDFNDIESFDHYIYDYCENSDIKGIEELVLKNTFLFNKLFCVKKFYNKTTQKIYNLNNEEFVYPELIYGASASQASVYGIIVEKCKNSSIINNNHCYSDEIINQGLKTLIGYSIDFLDHNIIIDDYANPNSNIYHSIKNLYSFGSGYTTNHLNFLPTMLRTNNGYFLDNEVTLNSYKFSFNEKLTTLFSEEENPNKGIYAAFYFWFQNQEDTFVRSYKKIQDILGSITGIARIIFLCAKAINLLIHHYTYINDTNFDLKLNYRKILDKTSSMNKESLFNNTIKLKNNSNNLLHNSHLNLNPDKSNARINNYINEFERPNNKLKKIFKNNIKKISFWAVTKNYVFFMKNQYIDKLIKLRQYVISEEIMFKLYFIAKSIYGTIAFDNTFSKEFDISNENLNNSIFNYENKKNSKKK